MAQTHSHTTRSWSLVRDSPLAKSSVAYSAHSSAPGSDLSPGDTWMSQSQILAQQELTTRRKRETDPEIAPGQGRWGP